jgi:thiol-disulfide isomerase/thioredoxin
LALALVPIGALLVACSGHGAVANGPQSGDQGYISGNGTIKLVTMDRRVPAPPISGESLTGSVINVRDFAGGVVVVNFWASWCPPCRSEQTHLNQVYTAEKSKSVAFIGVDIRDQDAAARAFQRTHDVSYASIVDESGSIALGFTPRLPATPPTTVVIDREGRVAATIIGEVPVGVLQPMVDQVVAERGTSG